MGTSICRHLPTQHNKDHPHACGDKVKTYCVAYRAVGSSPRVWGQGSEFPTPQVRIRIIPTRVGTREIGLIMQNLEKDHPHACGDKIKDSPFATPAEGSSPRVWGQVFFLLIHLCATGIIPTRVGTSLDFASRGNFSEDHPHACGDKIKARMLGVYKEGSSPRVWGQGHDLRIDCRDARIIPTRVGTRIMFSYHI